MDTLSAFKEFSVERMDTAKEAVAPQKNQAVLDGLGEDAEGNLTYKGEPITATTPSLPPIDAVVDFAEAYIHTHNTNCITIETSLLPINARVKRIEIPDVVSETDEYIQLEDMCAKDPMGLGSSYFVMYPKNAQGVFYTVAACVVFPTFPNSFYDAVDLGGYDNKTIKIYYEIEE